MPHALVIDDNVKNLSVLAQMLTLEKVTCTQVSNPNQLDQVLAGVESLDVIFLDLEMPGTDGYTLLGHLKADPRFQNTPVIAYTVHVSEVRAAYQNGFNGFLGKPLNAEKFPGQLRRILNGEAVWETV